MVLDFKKLFLVLTTFIFVLFLIFIGRAFATNNVEATNDPDNFCDVTVDQTSGVTANRSGDYCILSFKRVGTTVWTTPAWVSSVEYLIVAGGGGGGSYRGGGGGGGGVLQGTTSISGASQQIVVGAGGLGGYFSTVSPQNGSNSSGFGLTALGGGRGGSLDLPQISPSSGGSGGGGGAQDSGSQSGATGASGQGNSGGNGFHNGTTNGRSGGGGGAGASGGNGNSSATSAGNGGAGVQSAITGSFYGGGGGGGIDNRGTVKTAGVGGVGGGGNGGAGTVQNSPTLQATDGEPNTGGGGGGNGQGSSSFGSEAGRSGDGGSGIVVVKYAIPPRPSLPTNTATVLVDPRATSIELPLVELTSWVENRVCISISNSAGSLDLDGSDSTKYKVEISSGSGSSVEIQGSSSDQHFRISGTPAQMSDVFNPSAASKSRIKITKPSSGSFNENITLIIRSDNAPAADCQSAAPSGDPLLTATIKPYEIEINQKNEIILD